MTTPKGPIRIPVANYDGEIYMLELDASGFLRVVTETTALPSDAATETTLALVRDRIGALTSPATGSVNEQLELIRSYLDNVETLLNGGLPAALDGTALKVKEQSPITGYALATGQATALTELQQKLETADLSITASKELVVLLSGLVGVVETSLVAFAGGILKTAPGLSLWAKGEQVGILGSSATWTNVLNEAGAGVLERIQFATDYNDAEIGILVDGPTSYTLTPTGNTWAFISPVNLNSLGGEDWLWKESKYSIGDDEYAMFTKHAIQYSTSIRVRIRQVSGGDKNVGCLTYSRPIG